MKLFDQKNFDSMIAGYSHNGEFMDANGKRLIEMIPELYLKRQEKKFFLCNQSCIKKGTKIFAG